MDGWRNIVQSMQTVQFGKTWNIDHFLTEKHYLLKVMIFTFGV